MSERQMIERICDLEECKKVYLFSQAQLTDEEIEGIAPWIATVQITASATGLTPDVHHYCCVDHLEVALKFKPPVEVKPNGKVDLNRLRNLAGLTVVDGKEN